MLDTRTAWTCGRTQQEGRRGGQHRARRQALSVVGAPDGRKQQQRRRVAARQQRRAPANMVSWITRMLGRRALLQSHLGYHKTCKGMPVDSHSLLYLVPKLFPVKGRTPGRRWHCPRPCPRQPRPPTPPHPAAPRAPAVEREWTPSGAGACVVRYLCLCSQNIQHAGSLAQQPGHAVGDNPDLSTERCHTHPHSRRRWSRRRGARAALPLRGTRRARCALRPSSATHGSAAQSGPHWGCRHGWTACTGDSVPAQ